MSKEAMKLALEALLHCKDAIVERGLNGSPEFAEKWGLTLPLERADQAITALREALAQERSSDEQPAQQEPVAWIGQSEHLLSWDRFYDDMTPLYTSPPAQRKPLTDEQIEIGRRAPWGEVLDPFTAGVRFAETRHDITKGGAA